MAEARRTTQSAWPGSLGAFRTDDPAMSRCLELAYVAARTDLPVLILGESGTGKTLLARAIHNSSPREDAAFVSFNAAALSDTLLDSQLFGHEKGAFTGADRPVKGKFEQADGGTLFLDEIADLSISAQAKVLRAIEYGEFERLGSEDIRTADVRLITATHLPLADFVRSSRFRMDLFYRIRGITLQLPSLRERPSDLRALIVSEITRVSRALDKPIIGLEESAWEKLLGYSWPGNLRELSRVIHVAVVLTEGDVISEEVLLLDPDQAVYAPHTAAPAPAAAPAPGPANGDLRLKTAEKRHIQMVLERHAGNKRQTAKVLGVSRSTLDRKLEAYGLE